MSRRMPWARQRWRRAGHTGIYLVSLPVLTATLAVTAVALGGGMAVGRLTGRPMLRSGLRQLLMGAVAVGITFGVGSLIGSHG